MFLKKGDTCLDDLSLWKSFLAGNEDAYTHIYEKYARNLFMQGLQFSSDKELVRDCIHDIFVKIYENRANLKPVHNLKVYLFIALRNSISTAFKKQRVWFEELEEETTNVPDSNTVEEDFIDKENEQEQERVIIGIFSVLTMRQREAVYYRFIQSMSIDEICVIMEMNYQSVQNLLQRSIKKIKESYKKIEKK